VNSGRHAQRYGDGRIPRLVQDSRRLVVEDKRCIGRYANIESAGTTNTFNEDILIGLMNIMPDDWGRGRTYVNNTVMTQMESVPKTRATSTTPA